MFRGLELWFLALAVGLVALVYEIMRLAHEYRQGTAPEPPLPDQQPRKPDGLVEIASLENVRKVPNLRDRRFHQYLGLQRIDSPRPVIRGERRPIARIGPLLGQAVLSSVFIGRDGRSWSDSEIARHLRALERTGRWLEREAARWGALLNIHLSDTYFAVDDGTQETVEIGFQPEGNDVGPSEANAIDRALILMSRAASSLGFRDAADMVEQVNSRWRGFIPVWLIHLRCAGRSIAVPLDQTELEGVSLAVCYAREASFTEPSLKIPAPDPVTFAHELLHLFGASDKYNRPLSSFPRDAVTRHDIMRLEFETLGKQRIDALTAAEIGWAKFSILDQK